MSSQEIDALTRAEYKAGFVTDIEQDDAAARPERGRRPLHLGEEGRAGVDDRVAAQGLPALADDEGADLGPTCSYPPIDYQAIFYYSAPKQKKDGPKSLDEVDPEAARDLREARHPAARAGEARGRRRRRGLRQRLGRDDVQGEARGSWASSSARSPRRCRSTPSSCGSTSASVVPATDNFFAALNSAVFSDGSFVLRAEGRALPDGAEHLLPDQRREHRPVRAHADRRRGGRLRELPRGLHRADARREPAPRRGRRARRARGRARSSTRRCRTGTRATRTARAASSTSSPSAASAPGALAASPGRRSRPARRSPGSTRPASCRATTRWASSTRWRSRTTTSRPTPAPR